MRYALLALALATVTLMTGCARQTLTQGATCVRPLHAVASDLPPIELGGAYPLDAPTRDYFITSGPDAGQTLRRDFQPLGDGRTRLTEMIVQTGETLAIVVLSRDSSGDVVVHEAARSRRGLVTRFDPPMLFAPTDIAPGERVTQDLRVTTHPIDDPSTTRDSGRGTLELVRGEDMIERDSQAPFATLTSTLRVRLGPASIESDSTYTLTLPSERQSAGLTRRESARTVRVFGFVAERESDSIQ